MNLDDTARMRELDRGGMLAEIDALPEQLEAAWDLGRRLPLERAQGIRAVVVAGMGGSAIGADLLLGYAAPELRVPVVVWRDYDLPGYARGPDCLVIASSHSGNTEETVSAFEAGRRRGTRLLAVTTGGELARMADEAGAPVWQFEHAGQPRAAVGYSFGLLLAAAVRLGILPDPGDEVSAAAEAMRRQAQSLRADVQVVHNPAKRMAGQLMDRWPTILGAGLAAPVARRWRTQIAELAKAVAQFEALPEADHNMVAGVTNPELLFGRTMVVFLRASLDHPRNVLRIEATRQAMMVEGFNTDIIDAAGDRRLAQQWTLVHYGDYVGFYLAIAYGVDPTPVPAIEELKERLKAAGA